MSQLATQDDVRAALRRELTATEEEWIGAVLDEASDLVAGYLDPFQIPSPTPPQIARVVASMAAAVLNRPASILPDTQSLTAHTYGVQFAPGSTSPGPYLTDGFKKRLRPFKITAIEVALNSERT
jgi:hypothetical protein